LSDRYGLIAAKDVSVIKVRTVTGIGPATDRMKYCQNQFQAADLSFRMISCQYLSVVSPELIFTSFNWIVLSYYEPNPKYNPVLSPEIRKG